MSRREMMKRTVEEDLPLSRSTPGPPVYYPAGKSKLLSQLFCPEARFMNEQRK